MKKVLAIIAMLAIPGMSMAAGLVGDCYDCHTMHNSEAGQAVAQIGTVAGTTTSANPIANLLRLDCMACHANDPVAGNKIWTMPGGSEVPQVAHGDATGDLAGGNFSYGFVGNGTVSQVHNVKELFTAGSEDYTPAFGNPPGMVGDGSTHTDIFTTSGGPGAYDQFTCAGARGCHGTRAQLVGNGTGNIKRVGMAAISGAHHSSYDGAKDATNYTAGAGTHDGAKVAEGYRFIPGLKGYGNEQAGDRWENFDANSHNEYYGDAAGGLTVTGCDNCHNGFTAVNATMNVPNNSVSGFCSTCHGNFHSSGAANDVVDNGFSGAFLRHPSDYIIPNQREYAAYTAYDVSAPVARPALATATSALVTPGTDMVMCLSCHQAHGTANDYILRFDYATMTAGGYPTISAARAAGGCLACHTEKGAAIQSNGLPLP